ncbi:MAG TPA: L,D-transpeptidase [Jatrophihabitantaceae bacterium]|jgi:lipoprotein-anchoring transpeptidase ErfK/SrfK
MSSDDTDGELERLVAEALAAKARGSVGDERVPPPLSLTGDGRDGGHRRNRARFLAPLSAAAAVLLAVGLLFAFRGPTTVAGHVTGSGNSPSVTHSGGKVPAPVSSSAAIAVHVSLKWSDGAQFGVGIPVIAYFSKKITDGRAFAAATTVTVNGAAVQGAWYFELSDNKPGYPVEAHYRLQGYWPAHAKIHVALPVAGKSAGSGMAFDDNLTLDFRTGAANIATVSDAAHQLTLTSDGSLVGKFPVALGAPDTRTSSGTKVIMEKGASICMKGPGYDECGIKFTQRLTYGGEYLHSAPWNVYNITHGVDSSNGCTNLLPTDAQKLFGMLEIGDVVLYPDANGGKMQMAQGYGDWNVPWSQWLTGGAVSTH